MHRPLTVLAVLSLALAACRAVPEGRVRTAHLGREGGDAAGFEELRARFAERNPGFDIAWHAGADEVPGAETVRVVFVQEGEGAGSVGEARSDLACGDIVLLRSGEALALDAPLSVLTFTVPRELPPELPTFVRPDWDPKITDTPGGCATETGAYRRILLTWLAEKGPYVYHALNAHRVRITDSFTHYHPVQGGFDEFYLVQMVQPGAKLITSERTADLTRPGELRAADVGRLLHEQDLAVGDLVYLPRGVVHRGVGGVLAQVITIPGFKPGAEIGVDHHLRAINERFALSGEDALPLNEEASHEAVVR